MAIFKMVAWTWGVMAIVGIVVSAGYHIVNWAIAMDQGRSDAGWYHFWFAIALAWVGMPAAVVLASFIPEDPIDEDDADEDDADAAGQPKKDTP